VGVAETFGWVVVAWGVVAVALGWVVVAAGVVDTDLAEITGALVVGADVVATVGRVLCADCVGAAVWGAAGLVVTAAGRVATTVVRCGALLCDSSAEGCHAGSSVARTERSGRAMEGFAAPPTTVTAPTDFGPSNNWNTPMMPVRMNIVMSHNCQRLALTPIAIVSLSRHGSSHATKVDLWSG
jgi:hypothetical protein